MLSGLTLRGRGLSGDIPRDTPGAAPLVAIHAAKMAVIRAIIMGTNIRTNLVI